MTLEQHDAKQCHYLRQSAERWLARGDERRAAESIRAADSFARTAHIREHYAAYNSARERGDHLAMARECMWFARLEVETPADANGVRNSVQQIAEMLL